MSTLSEQLKELEKGVDEKLAQLQVAKTILTEHASDLTPQERMVAEQMQLVPPRPVLVKAR